MAVRILPDARLEEGLWRLGLERRSGLDPDRHQLAVGRQVEELLAVPAPDGSRASGRRDLPLPSRAGVGNDVDLEAARLVGGIGDEVPVEREISHELVEFAVEERD